MRFVVRCLEGNTVDERIKYRAQGERKEAERRANRRRDETDEKTDGERERDRLKEMETAKEKN